jgi:hypothetical protein
MEQVGAVYFIGFFRSRDIGSTVDHHPVLRPSRSGATENATVVGESCADLEQRGRETSRSPRLYVLDGAKALNGRQEAGAGDRRPAPRGK